jgi:hypothetical protein
MDGKEEVKDQQGANGAALAIALPAMSLSPLLCPFRFFFAAICLSPDPSSDHSAPLHAGPGPPRRGITQGSRLAHRASRPLKATKSARDVREAGPHGCSQGAQLHPDRCDERCLSVSLEPLKVTQ